MAIQSSAVPTPVPVLVTRSEAEAQAFAAALTHRFGVAVRPVLAPLMAVQPLSPPLPEGPFAGVIFTSANAVAVAVGLRPRLPGLAWCVGDRTAARARAEGFQARSAKGDADALVRSILADPPSGRLLHLHGAETRGEVAARLTSAGVETAALAVYRQIAQPLSGEGRALLRSAGAVIVPLFSPQSAARFAAEAASAAAALHLVAMSAAVAEAARWVPHRSLRLAACPEAGAMLDAVAGALADASAP
jgi:uroporphyrinogen-III synthase